MTSITAPETQLGDETLRGKILTPRQLAWLRFRRHRGAMFGAFMLLLLVLYVTFGGLIFANEPCYATGKAGEGYANCNDTSRILEPPSAEHPFGTDTIGRDILARTIYGGQISLLIGFFAALLEIIIGTLVGALAAYYGGWVDNLLMRITEAMLTIPQLFLLIIAAQTLGGKVPGVELFGRAFSGSIVVIVLIIALTSWMSLARIVRANILSLKEQDYIAASRALGASNSRIIFAHLLPNTAAPIIVSATLGVAAAILNEAYISFLGLGVQQPTASWGNMLDRAYRYLEAAPWMWIFPGLFILITVLSVNFMGDGLRDALDPRSSRSSG